MTRLDFFKWIDSVTLSNGVATMLFGLVYLFAACSQINNEVFANLPLGKTKSKDNEQKSTLMDGGTEPGWK